MVASSQGKPALLDVLDVIGDQTRLDVQANSELRICHYRTRQLLTLRGPLRASISAAGVTADNGKPVTASAERCAEPVVSSFQGGLVARNMAPKTTKVPLRPSIKVVNHGTKTISHIALWDGAQRNILVRFDRNAARPILDDGRSYLLVVERSDGSTLKMMLEATAETHSGPLILVAR